MPIPEGYARVMVDRVEPGWEDLDLEIPGGDGEEELGQAIHTASEGEGAEHEGLGPTVTASEGEEAEHKGLGPAAAAS